MEVHFSLRKAEWETRAKAGISFTLQLQPPAVKLLMKELSGPHTYRLLFSVWMWPTHRHTSKGRKIGKRLHSRPSTSLEILETIAGKASCICLLTSTTDRKEVSLLQTPLVISWEHHLQLFQTPLVAHLNLMGHWVPLPFTREVLGGSRICVARKRPYCTQWGRKGTADLQLSQPVCLRRVCCNVLLKSFGWALFLRK